MKFEKILNNGILFNIYQRIVLGKKGNDCMKKFFTPTLSYKSSGDERRVKVLDIGCGPGTYVPYLLDTDYTGIDVNDGNITLAKRKYAKFPNIKFITDDVSKCLMNDTVFINTYDIIFMSGILHHLSMDDKRQILSYIPKLLEKENGEFRSCDSVYTKEQPKISKWVMSHDRGKYILEMDDYIQLIKEYLPFVECNLRSDCMLFPFPYPIMFCKGCLNEKTRY